tara:strand:+ start:187 stop:1434 length:1248 start_codon:yes stop_codon:yes gene_type:complete
MIKSRDILAMTLALVTCNNKPTLEEAPALYDETPHEVIPTQPSDSLEDLTYGGLLASIEKLSTLEERVKVIAILNTRMTIAGYSELLLSPDDKVYTLGDIAPTQEELSSMSDWVTIARPQSRLYSENISPDLEPNLRDSLEENVSWIVTTPLLINSAIKDKRSPYLQGTISTSGPATIFVSTRDGYLKSLPGFSLTLVHELDHVEKFSLPDKERGSRLELEYTALATSIRQLDYALEQGTFDPEYAETYREHNRAKAERARFLLDRDSKFGSAYPETTILPSQLLEASKQTDSEVDKRFLKQQRKDFHRESPNSAFGEELFWSIIYAQMYFEHGKKDTINLLCSIYNGDTTVGLRINAVEDTLTYLVPDHSASDVCSNLSLVNATVEGGELKVSSYRDIQDGDNVLVYQGLGERE